MKRHAFFLTLLLSTISCLHARTSCGWTPDILSDGYEMRTVNHPDDYSGKVVSTIIRKLVSSDSLGGHTHRGVLYIHGFNDYFFQKDMGDRFVRHGYDFYAVDLRRYGRSIMEDQKPFDVRNMTEYFPDIDSALVAMQQSGISEIILMGHSTGGLTDSYFESRRHPESIKALILNSPFLDWNQGWKERIIPIVSTLGSIWPEMKISQDGSTAYGESLLKSHRGEWLYNTDWKQMRSPDVNAGWIRAVTMAQNSLRDGKADIKIPILLLYSSKSVNGSEWAPEFNRGDAVLDVDDIKKYGRELGPNVTCVKVMEGMHDLVLSAPGIREPLYRYIFSWLTRKGL